MPSRLPLYVALIAPFLLSACGEGWEAKLTNTHFPYGNERTAGSGVMYVRAHMMPEKQLILEPAPAPVVAPEPNPLEEIFEDSQVK